MDRRKVEESRQEREYMLVIRSRALHTKNRPHIRPGRCYAISGKQQGRAQARMHEPGGDDCMPRSSLCDAK